jgi:hypothetical protein
MNLREFLDAGKLVFSCGEIPGNLPETGLMKERRIESQGYFVSHGIKGLHLKFHGENWLMKLAENQKSRLNYGRIMHEIFESIATSGDIKRAVDKMVIEGKVTETDRKEIEERTMRVISDPKIRDWFEPGLKIMNEAEILTAEGTARRPDRVIIKDDKVIVVDFKFGVEKREYMNQVNNYRRLLLDMGYPRVDAFLWYVDNNKIVSA